MKGPDGDDITPEQLQKIAMMVIKVTLILPLLLILAWGAFSSFYIVQAEERGVVMRFGKLKDVSSPGLHFKLPFGIDQVHLVATERVLKEEFGFRTRELGERTDYETTGYEEESLMLTGDLNVIDVSWVVQYRIADPVKYLFNIREPQQTLRDVSEAVMRRIVGNRVGSDVLTTARVGISVEARQEIQSIMDSYDAGLAIGTVELQDVMPPPRVQPAFNSVNVARQALEQMINEAEKRRNQRVPRTEGQALQLMAEAEGYAAERVNRAKGETARFTAILQEYRQAPEVTRKRLYLEMIDEVLPRAGRIVVTQDGQTGPIPLLNLNEGRTAPTGGSQ
ncbi:MAG: FtsH protease activity modulator HflK [Candidatus Sumerlaeia bacterium]|nr:FtsH protease activity modulator HflK [Candidatus Sumerlaeia bacterium]